MTVVEKHLQTWIPQIVVDMKERAFAEAAHTAQVIADDAKGRAPRLAEAISFPNFERHPGELAESIEVRQIGTAFAIGPVVYWGRFVEEGTVNMAAQPFLEPAAEEHAEPFFRAEARVLAGLR